MSYKLLVANILTIEPLTGSRVVMNFCSNSKIAINFGPFSVDYHHSQTCSLGFILCECGIGIVGFESLDLFEV